MAVSVGCRTANGLERFCGHFSRAVDRPVLTVFALALFVRVVVAIAVNLFDDGVLMPDERPGTPPDKTNPATFVVRRGPAAGSNVNLCSASLRRREKIQARSMRLPMDADFFAPRNYAISPRLERRELAARAEGAIGTVHGTTGGTGRFYIGQLCMYCRASLRRQALTSNGNLQRCP